MGKKSRREAQKAEEVKHALAATKAAEAKAAKEAKRALAGAKPEEARGPLATARDAVVKAGEAVAEVVTQAAQAVKEHVVEPVVAAVRKPKKARFVREKVAKKPVVKAAPLTPRSTKAAAKMMSKNMTLPPKEERTSSRKPKA